MASYPRLPGVLIEGPFLPESWWRTQSATMALLKHAYTRVEHMEQMMNAQQQKMHALEDLASTDALTGLLNRRGFERFFAQESARIRRHGGLSGVLALIDLDSFKRVNDSHGHLAGDACLQMTADTLRALIRATDCAARFGGDEFALFLTHTSPGQLGGRVERIREALAGLRMEWEGHTLNFTASLGVSHVTPDAFYAAAYHAADEALYARKRERTRALAK